MGQSKGTHRGFIPTLIKLAQDRNSNVRRWAVWALGELGPAAERAIPVLVETFHDDDYYIGMESEATLGKVCRAAWPALVNGLWEGNRHTRIKKMNILSRSEPAPECIPLMLQLFQHFDRNVRTWAASSFGKISPASREAVIILADALHDEDEVVRERAAMVLGEIGPAAEEAVPVLVDVLWSDDSERVRTKAAVALARIAPSSGDAGRAISWLKKSLHSDDYYISLGAAFDLADMGLPAVPALVEALRDEDCSVGWGAAQALGKMGLAAKGAIPALIETMTVGCGMVSLYAAEALGKIGPEAVPGVAEVLLSQSREDVRRRAARVIGDYGPASKEAVPALLRALMKEFNNTCKGEIKFGLESDEEDVDFTDFEISFEEELIKVLGKIGPGAQDAVPLLIEYLRAGCPEDRQEAICTLGKIGPGAKDAVLLLKEILRKSEDWHSRRNTALALQKIDPAVNDSIPIMIEVLDDEDRDIRLEAARMLGVYGTAARETMPRLLKLLHSESWREKEVAARAIRKIDPFTGGVLPALMESLHDKKKEVRWDAAKAIGKMFLEEMNAPTNNFGLL